MLSRVQLQQLAKQHGVKANMKSSDIEEALKALGVVCVAAPKGLSLRDPNQQERSSLGQFFDYALNTLAPAPKRIQTRKSHDLWMTQKQAKATRVLLVLETLETIQTRLEKQKSLQEKLNQITNKINRSTV